MPTQALQTPIPVIGLHENVDRVPGQSRADGPGAAPESTDAGRGDLQKSSTAANAEPTDRGDNRTYACFSIYRPTGYAVVKIMDADTGEILAQYPPSAVPSALDTLKQNGEPFDGSA